MSVISIKFNEEEEKVIKKFIESKGFSVSQYIKDLIFEKIEDEYDMQLIKDFEEREERNEVNLISFDELKKELEI